MSEAGEARGGARGIHRFHHPGSGRRRATPFPKGRQAEPEALAEVAAVLGDAPRRRDLLIEHLHRLQDRFGCLTPRHLAALAEDMRLAMAEVYEVATFYAHFDVVAEEGSGPPLLTVRVCDSLSCMLEGAEGLITALERDVAGEHAAGRVRVVRAPCMGRCAHAPAVEVGHRAIDRATPAAVKAAVAARATGPEIPSCQDFDAYCAGGGYAALRACSEGRRTLEEVTGAFETAGLRGLGGAGFPAHRKWAFVLAEPGPRVLTVNADEGEPGTFKDRLILEQEPHRVLEGALIAAWGVQAEDVYIYLRDEYPAARHILEREIGRVVAAGLAGPPAIHLRRGAGAYICGEESAMIESIEGKRGLPRHRPPYVAQVGVFGRPTLVHNVETLAWMAPILRDGGAAFAARGLRGHKGVRSFSVSGRVREPGVKLAPAGITMAELLEEFCGGMAEGHEFKAYLPGGASGGILPASLADIPLDFGALEEHGCFIGSHAVIVLSDKDDMRRVALNLMRFFARESCGQCTPCRVGTEKAAALMEAERWDAGLLAELGAAMRDASICGLGQAAANPMACVMRFFPEEIGGKVGDGSDRT